MRKQRRQVRIAKKTALVPEHTYYIIVAIILPVLLCPLSDGALAAYGSRVDIPSSPNPVGSGARALGMGGAFIAVADDATAASWNPAGLIQLEIPEMSVVGAHTHRIEDSQFDAKPEGSGRSSVDAEEINYFSLAYPFTLLNRNMIFSLNYQNLIDFTDKVDYYFLPPKTGMFRLDSNNRVEIEGGLYAIGLAYAIQMTPTLSFGFTLNFWQDWFGRNGWEKTNHETNSGSWHPFPLGVPMFSDYTRWDTYDFSGFNANLGAMWNINSKLTLGVVYKAPFTADLFHETVTRELTYMETDPRMYLEDGTPRYTTSDEQLEMPMSYGIGFSYRFSDQITISADIYRTEWQDFILRDSNGKETSPVSGRAVETSDIDPTHQIRVGAEFLFIYSDYIIPARGGVYYDPAPAEGHPDDFFGFSLGSGVAYKEFVFDVAYQYRFGVDVGASILQELEFSQNVDQHIIYASIIIHF
jgi:long-subunit fatty acid transport protein